MKKEVIKIGSFNIQNNKVNRLGTNNTQIVDFINQEKFDILGTQELTKKITKQLQEKLTSYKIIGKYRFGNDFILNIIHSVSNYNENNAIITKLKVIKNKTIRLPWSVETLPRIATIAIIETSNNKQLCFINTHLDYRNKSAKTKQLLKLPKIINKYIKYYPVILTGDFNSSVGQPYFDKFVSCLKEMGVERLPINKPTHNTHKISIDHIFITNNLKIIEADIVENTLINDISDHKPIFAKLEI